jgi:hypothetical protein
MGHYFYGDPIAYWPAIGAVQSEAHNSMNVLGNGVLEVSVEHSRHNSPIIGVHAIFGP